MGAVIRDARPSDYGFLCDAFAMANREHCEMRSDLYREVDMIAPRWQFNALTLGRIIPVLKTHIGNNYCIKVAENDDQLVGAVVALSAKRSALSWSSFPKEAYLENVVVLPSFRKQGIATELLKAAKVWAKDTGHEHMYGKILNNNEASLALFSKTGFTQDSTNVGMHIDNA